MIDSLYDKILAGLKDGSVKIICNDETLGEPAAKIGDNWFWYLGCLWMDYDSFDEYLKDNSIEAQAQQIEQALYSMAEDWDLFGDEVESYCETLGLHNYFNE